MINVTTDTDANVITGGASQQSNLVQLGAESVYEQHEIVGDGFPRYGSVTSLIELKKSAFSKIMILEKKLTLQCLDSIKKISKLPENWKKVTHL